MFKSLTDVRARDLMRSDLLLLKEEESVSKAVALMDKNNRGSIVVVNGDGDLSGIFTERDLLRRVVAKELNPKTTPLSKVITKDVRFASTNDDAIRLLEWMREQNFRHIPILEGKKVVGLVSLKQFYKFFLESQRSMGV